MRSLAVSFWICFDPAGVGVAEADGVSVVAARVDRKGGRLELSWVRGQVSVNIFHWDSKRVALEYHPSMVVGIVSIEANLVRIP